MTTLLLDIGNTRIKWAIWEGKIDSDRRVLLDHHDYLFHKDIGKLLQIWQNIPVPSHVFGACVTQEGIRQRVETAVKMRWGNAVYSEWLTPLNECSSLKCGYENPQQLGIDRWLSAIAAWKQAQSACLVVNSGTALTVDAISDQGKFLGGIVVPGIEAMREGLFKRAPTLRRHSSAITDDYIATAYADMIIDFPTNTDSAIETGLWRALSGAVHEQHDRLLAYCGRQTPISIWLAGGNAERLASLLAVPYKIVHDLVLQGSAWQAIHLHTSNQSSSDAGNNEAKPILVSATL